MVRRYPHKAIITIETDGSLVDGEWVDGSPKAIEIKGRLDPVDTNEIIRINSQGDEVVIRAEFYTNHKEVKGATMLEIEELGIKRKIICWWNWQSYSVISV